MVGCRGGFQHTPGRGMNGVEQMVGRAQLEAQLYDLWHDVDTNCGRTAAAFYTDDAVFGGKDITYTGRKEIESFYAWRVNRGDRVAVHSVTNFRAKFETPDIAHASWYLLAYAADGVAVLPSQAPIQICLVTDRHERQPDGKWLCAHRNFEVLFAGTAKPVYPKA